MVCSATIHQDGSRKRCSFRPSIRQLGDFQGLGKGRDGIAILIRFAMFRPVDRQKQLPKSRP